MIKINYLSNNEFKADYKKIIQEYYIKNNIDIKKSYYGLFRNTKNIEFSTDKLLENIISPFDTLVDISKEFKNRYLYVYKGHYYFDFKGIKKLTCKNPKFSDADKKKYEIMTIKLRSLFPYEKLQPQIASLFRKYHNEIRLSTCYYCNIDYINSFSSIGEYKNLLDFINYASIDELKEMPSITDNNVQSIIANQGTFKSEADIKSKVKYITIDKLKDAIKLNSHKHDHFTLDHFIDKGTYPSLALCLYNFVPSCYTCNSKLKKQINLTNNLNILSPTNDQFDFDAHVKFKIFSPFDETKRLPRQEILSHNLGSIKNSDDFLLDLVEIHPSKYTEYIHTFKLKSRYAFHKKEILKLIKNQQSHPDVQIKSMLSAIYEKKDPSEINGLALALKKAIFGEAIFSGELDEIPLTKLKRDIAKNIGII